MERAARKGNIHELNDLISSNEQILEEMALEGAGHTPLHIACVGGHLDFIRELLKHMPKLAEKVDPCGFSPLHIAAARGDVEIAKELLKVGTHLCSVEGWERRIPLHYAVIHGEVDVMEILLSTSPESVEKKTAWKETALHLAVKNNRFKVLVRLVEHLKRHKKEQVINLKDHKDNTALHLAVTSKNFEVVDFLLRGHTLEYEVVEVNALNESGLTPLDVSTHSQRGARDKEIREILVRAGAKCGASRPVSRDDDDIEAGNCHQSYGELVSNAPRQDDGKKWSKIEVLLVVAGLIANATYQSVLQPPSVVEHDKTDNTSGQSKVNISPTPAHPTEDKITYSANLVYVLFLGGNTFGFLVSIQIIIWLTKMIQDKKNGQYKNTQIDKEEENQERYVFWLIMLSMIAMVLTYFCFTLSLLIKYTGGGGKKVLNVLPLMIAVFLLLIQKKLVMILKFFSEELFRCLGRMRNSD
ncbi:hypothetical protein EUGRSUZ_E01532 [Eucalyptus grandis]|uniref:PGG domain-containing protein n=2 Tax=Eucalyptus grandis TaxID=71139 RepID=A0A059C401_EUCGR|nr:hypothetical protein EUGRSUZ_E01532 [Eucalyptus grandis]